MDELVVWINSECTDSCGLWTVIIKVQVVGLTYWTSSCIDSSILYFFNIIWGLDLLFLEGFQVVNCNVVVGVV